MLFLWLSNRSCSDRGFILLGCYRFETSKVVNVGGVYVDDSCARRQ